MRYQELLPWVLLCLLCVASCQASANVVQVAVLDPLGNSVSTLDGLWVRLDETQVDVGPEGRFVFTDVSQGNHILTVSRGHDIVHSRSLYIDREEIILTASLPWSALPDPDWFDTAIPLPNWGFEEPMADAQLPGWYPIQSSPMGSPQLRVSDAYAYDGKHSLQVAGRHSDKSIWVRSEKMPASPGVYAASAHVYCAEKSGPNPQLYLEFWNSANTRIDLQSVPISGRLGEWERVFLKATAPAQTAFVTVWFYFNTTYTGVTYWDNVKLARLD
ncbi:MAG: hypothetical protein ACOX4G_15180 [Limnochordia bacterium]|jgi:hypothetical protein